MFLTEETGTGEFYFLAFGFKKYCSDEGLIYRKGLAVTGESFNSAAIVSQNFLVFKNDYVNTTVIYSAANGNYKAVRDWSN